MTRQVDEIDLEVKIPQKSVKFHTLEGTYFGHFLELSRHIGALWTEGPFEKFQCYILPMKNQFFFPGILLDNSLTFKMTCWNCM